MFAKLQMVAGFQMAPMLKDQQKTLGLYDLDREVSQLASRRKPSWTRRDVYVRDAILRGFGRGREYDRKRPLSGVPYYGPQYPSSLYFAAKRWNRESDKSIGASSPVPSGISWASLMNSCLGGYPN